MAPEATPTAATVDYLTTTNGSSHAGFPAAEGSEAAWLRGHDLRRLGHEWGTEDASGPLRSSQRGV
jgi:hypothetical protein